LRTGRTQKLTTEHAKKTGRSEKVEVWVSKDDR